MVITRSLEKACTGPFWTNFYFAFFGLGPEPAEPEPAEPALKPNQRNRNQPDQEPNEIEPNRNFLSFGQSIEYSKSWPKAAPCSIFVYYVGKYDIVC